MRQLELPRLFERYRTEIGATMRAAFTGRNLPLYEMLQYHLGWLDEQGKPTANSGGKALRPTLCLLACDAVSGDYRQALPAAVATEMVHNFSLIHDDIEDDDRERRHRPTVWYLWGKPQAINAGSAMLLLSSLALFRMSKTALPAAKQFQVTQTLNESCLEMIEGQYLDISFESRLDIGVDEYLDMIDKKTGALIGCTLELGALIGSDDPSVAASFRRCGRKLGAAFQIRDDILGIWGDEKLTGKPLAADIRRKKKSLPVVYGLKQARDLDKDELLAIYAKEALTGDDVSRVLSILDKLNVHAYAQSMAREMSQQATHEIEGLSLMPSAQADLIQLADFLVERDF